MNWRIGSTAVMVLAVGGAFGGCCHIIQPPPKPIGGLPAPISMEQQIAELNARAVQLPRIRARSTDGNVQVVYPDEKGNPITSPAGSGILLLQQVYATHGAKLFLSVRAELRDVFNLGRNEQEWWAVQFAGERHAWTGPARRDFVRDPQSRQELFDSLTQAIPELLGVTEIAPDSGEKIVMKVDDEHGVNDLLILRAADDAGAAMIEREIVVDRRTGEVQEVDLYRPNGQLLARASLSDYRPVTYKGGGPTEGSTVPMMPRNVILDCPGQQHRQGHRFTAVEVPANFAENQFSLPVWEDLGIKPERVE